MYRYSEPNEAEEVLKNLSSTYKTHRTSFNVITKLMDKCDKLDDHPGRSLPISNVSTEKSNGGNPLLAGIIPGNN